MLYSILTSLAVLATLIAVVAWIVGFVSAARAFGHRGSQLLSTEIKALRPPGVTTDTDRVESAVEDLKRRLFKSMLVFIICLALSTGLILLRNWALAES
ncbi:hypothetical protein LRH25_02305 [Ideonella azotifigens]|uniref:Uncharacterized protein n=1 Tax=Ideonella azotifigens TaxID=513160 RepID=A0ABN1KLF3_9BURK|nr:hypothetical protein [Ideonella azotifigens]MCD2339168.1 hypothetical protein [Ideonella azotifigens]